MFLSIFVVLLCLSQLAKAAASYSLNDTISVVENGTTKKFLVTGKTIHEMPEGASIVDFSITPLVKFPVKSINKVTGVSLGAYNLTSSVHGIKAGIYNLDYGNSVALQVGAVNQEGKELLGAQLAFVGNAVDGSLKGVQAGLLYNTCLGDYGYGLQFAVVNLNEKGLGGVSAGVINFDAGQRDGLHVGLVNFAGLLQGAQLGLFNFAGNQKSGGGFCRGIQVGLINSCEGALQGIQIGILNTARSNALSWSLGINVGF